VGKAAVVGVGRRERRTYSLHKLMNPSQGRTSEMFSMDRAAEK
jgi:hypothetical protein